MLASLTLFIIIPILAITTGFLFSGAQFGVNFPIWITLILLLGYFVRYRKLQELRLSRYDILSALALLLSWSTILYIEPGLKFYSTWLTIILILPALLLPFKPKLHPRFSIISNLIVQPLEVLTVIFYPETYQRLKNNFIRVGSDKSSIDNNLKIVWQIFLGIGLSIFVFIIFVPLLTTSDPIFAEALNNFFSNIFRLENIRFEVIFQFLFWVGFSFIFLGLIFGYVFFFHKKHAYVNYNYNQAKKGLNAFSGNILFGSINILFVIYVAFQFVYLFGGEDNISATGYNYSEYARAGFFELQWLVFFVLIITYLAIRFVFSRNKLAKLVTKINLATLILLTLVIIFSAHTRLSLYEEVYGFTYLRLYSHVAIFVEAIMFICLFIMIFMRNWFKHFSFILIIIVSTTIFSLAVINPARFITVQNLNLDREVTDYSGLLNNIGEENFYLYVNDELQSDLQSSSETISFYSDQDYHIEEVEKLYCDYEGIFSDEFSDWRDFNLVRTQIKARVDCN